MSEIIIRNVRKEFDNFVAVQSSSFTIEDGEFFMLLGHPAAARPPRCA
jgi:multiple sugar transport system ATP-binding protein